MFKIHLRSMILILLCLGIAVFAAPLNSGNPVQAQEEGPTILPEEENGFEDNSVTPMDEFISAGLFNSCGVKSDGTVACWGYNSNGQSTPPAGTFKQVSAGGYHTCGIKSNGTIACWGKDDYDQSTPPAGTFKQVSAGNWYNCGVKSNGTVACWGNNSYGEAIPPAGTFKQVSAGGYHACGIKGDGSVKCWGDDTLKQSTPPAGTFIQVSSGFWHNCGLKSNGLVACWGDNGHNQSSPPAGTFTQVSAGDNHTCGVKSDGSVRCWGKNDDGQSTPPAGTFKQVSAGGYHSCGVKSNGTVACWGWNNNGQSTPPTGIFGPRSTAPNPFRPSGNTYATRPAFSWSRISGATSYRLVVYRITPAATVVDKTVSSTACSTTTNRCSYTPTTVLTNSKSYKWKVLATNAFGSSPYSAYLTFKVLPGINSTFNGAYTGWLKHPGGSWFITSSAFYTNGATGKYSSASYNATFGDFAYQARVRQPSTNSSSFSGLVVRGYPAFNSLNNWTKGLFFVTNKDGKYKVYKTVSGTSATLKNWTSSTYIVKSNWNTLKVTADGSHYRFYINGHLVWSGTDTSRSSGRVGLITYSKSTAEKFYADWARLTMSDYYNK